MKFTSLIVAFLSAALTAGAQQQSQVLLAVFAHPDDEILIGPVLAHYAQNGVDVYLAIATKGEKGAFPHSGIPAGDQLAKVRREEATCSCQQLGIKSPIFFAMNDGEIGSITRPPGLNVQTVADNVQRLIAELKPSVVVTWGADGGYGHPDHRLVSAAVTQVIQSSASPLKLFYVGFTPEDAKRLDEVLPPLRWHATDAKYLSVGIAVEKSDRAAAVRSLECHKSQFAPEAMKVAATVTENRSVIWFRPWSTDRKSSDLFK